MRQVLTQTQVKNNDKSKSQLNGIDYKNIDKIIVKMTINNNRKKTEKTSKRTVLYAAAQKKKETSF